jgi:D-3-phosphoglycerate dehydrogenase
LKMLGNDIIEIGPDFILEQGMEMVSFEELMVQSDFISVNCDLNETSYHLINEESLSFIKQVAVLINTARGPIVDENALIKYLHSGKIAGAALDVFEVEPLPLNSPLLSMDNVLLAPHNSNSSPKAWEKVHWNTIRNLLIGLGMDTSGLEKFNTV